MSSGLGVVVVVAAWLCCGVVHGDAGHFFAETPKHLPRIGRRGDLPALATLMIEEDTRTPTPRPASIAEALALVDGDGDGCLSVAEVLRIPVVRVAVLLQNPDLLTPTEAQAQPRPQSQPDKDGGSYASERRPEPRLLQHYLQK